MACPPAVAEDPPAALSTRPLGRNSDNLACNTHIWKRPLATRPGLRPPSDGPVTSKARKSATWQQTAAHHAPRISGSSGGSEHLALPSTSHSAFSDAHCQTLEQKCSWVANTSVCVCGVGRVGSSKATPRALCARFLKCGRLRLFHELLCLRCPTVCQPDMVLLCPLAQLPLLIYLFSSEHLVSSHVLSLSPPCPRGVSGEWCAVRGCVVFGVWCAVSAGSGPCGITDTHGLPS